MTYIRGFSLVVTLPLLAISGEAFAQQNPFGQILGGIFGGVKQQAAKREWKKVSPEKRECVDVAMAPKKLSIQKFIQGGIPPADVRLNDLMKFCQTMVQTKRSLKTNSKCRLPVPGGQKIETLCDETFAKKVNGRLVEISYLEAIRYGTSGQGQVQKQAKESQQGLRLRQNQRAQQFGNAANQYAKSNYGKKSNFSQQLNALIDEAEKSKAADPRFLKDLRDNTEVVAVADFHVKEAEKKRLAHPLFIKDLKVLIAKQKLIEAKSKISDPVRISKSREPNLDSESKKMVQRALKNRGYYRSAIDGSFGQGTRTAISMYQKNIGEPATGYLTNVQSAKLIAEGKRQQREAVPVEKKGKQKSEISISRKSIKSKARKDMELIRDFSNSVGHRCNKITSDEEDVYALRMFGIYKINCDGDLDKTYAFHISHNVFYVRHFIGEIVYGCFDIKSKQRLPNRMCRGAGPTFGK